MVSTIAFLTNLSLLTFMALAVPTSKLDALLSRRHIDGKSQLINRDVPPSFVNVYDRVWAGVMWEESPNTFSIITGTFTVPTTYGINGASIAIWVGIRCPGVVLQVGIISEINNGNAEYRSFYEWYPVPSGSLNVDIHAGDVITATVFALDETSGRVIIDNKTTGVTVWQDLTSSAPLCREDAAWIVEDYKRLPGGAVPLAHFGQVEFTGTAAYGPNGNTYTPALISVYDILQEGTVRTSTHVSLDGTITVRELNDP